MKNGLLGFGYWGKILSSNIDSLTGQKPVVHDPQCGIINKEEIGLCDNIFIATPAITHDELVSDFLSKGKNVFCEKPLCLSSTMAKNLYEISEDNNAHLFVDWIFTFNDAVNHISHCYDSGEYGSIRSVRMNRLNSGPERKDTSSKWDLASHDVSILQYIFDETPTHIDWKLFRRNDRSFFSDTCVGIIQYPSFDATINASWEYGRKDRECVFEFDAGFLTWDDTVNSLRFNGQDIVFPKTRSPLENSIETFLSLADKGDMSNHAALQKKLTTVVTEILENGE